VSYILTYFRGEPVQHGIVNLIGAQRADIPDTIVSFVGTHRPAIASLCFDVNLWAVAAAVGNDPPKMSLVRCNENPILSPKLWEQVLPRLQTVN
jgi:hypothetical protein